MRPLPADPMAQHERFMAAWCADYGTREDRAASKTPRADAVVAVARETRRGK